MITLFEEKDIYCDKTKSYFTEVLSCYSNGNYRSAIVMLYSIAICDLIYKLQDLRDIYNDGVAKDILNEIEKTRSNYDAYTKSKWEKDLVERVFKNTELLDLQAYTELNHLHDFRNFSSHPSMNESYELVAPSREVTIACINSTLNNILVKPPLFAKKIIETLSEDIADKKDIYINDNEKFKRYLNSKYFSRMSTNMKKSTFKALWKFCFILSEDKDCIENRYINRKALEYLYESTPNIDEYIMSEGIFKNTSKDKQCLITLNRFLANYPTVYALLSEDTHLMLSKLRDTEVSVDYTAWYENDKITHLKELIGRERFKTISTDYLRYIKEQYSVIGQEKLVLDFCIKYFSSCRSYDEANLRYEQAVRPYLSRFDHDQYVCLIKAINDNNQIYGRNSAITTNTEVYMQSKEKLGLGFDYSNYPRFKYNDSESDIPDPVDESDEF